MATADRKQAAGSGFFSGKRPRVIGHRGTAGTVPENTLESFQQALFDGADILETDVHLSADGEVIISHDPTVDRTTDGTGAIATMTVSQLKQLDAGYRFTTDGGKTFPFRGKGLKIPTFEEMLWAFPGIPINVEIKVDNPVLTEKCLSLLRKYNRVSDVTVLVAAVKNRLARHMRALEPHLVTGHSRQEIVLFYVLTRLHLSWLFRSKGRAFQVPFKQGRVQVVTPEFIEAAHRQGIEVHVWTVNEEPEMRKYLQMGADALFTDFPGRMRKLVDSGDFRAPGRRGSP